MGFPHCPICVGLALLSACRGLSLALQLLTLLGGRQQSPAPPDLQPA
jgi:hypothetical protein